MFDMLTGKDRFVLLEPSDPDNPDELVPNFVHHKQADIFHKLLQGFIVSRNSELSPVNTVTFEIRARDRDEAQEKLDAHDGD